MLESLDDQLLVKMIKAENHAAFKEVYKRYWKQLFVAAQRKLKPDELCEEVVQNTFMSLWEKRNQVSVENLRSYLFSSLKYQIIDQLRKRVVAEKYVVFVQSRPEEFGQSPDEPLHLDRVMSVFEDVFRLLPEKTSRIFYLSRIEHMTTKEIARQLDIPERTVEYHITQSLRMLRRQLGDYLPLFAAVLLY